MKGIARVLGPTCTYRAALASAGVFGLLALTVLGFASPARATPACGAKVLADWYDNGRVDRVYDLRCYEQAIDAIPSEIRDYSDAEEVITRALQAAGRNKLPRSRVKTPGDDANDDSGPGETKAAPKVDTSAPSAVPLPLVVLGAMSLALLGAGGLGYLSRRRQIAEIDDSTDEDSLA